MDRPWYPSPLQRPCASAMERRGGNFFAFRAEVGTGANCEIFSREIAPFLYRR